MSSYAEHQAWQTSFLKQRARNSPHSFIFLKKKSILQKKLVINGFMEQFLLTPVCRRQQKKNPETLLAAASTMEHHYSYMYMYQQIWAPKWKHIHKTYLKCCGLGHQGRVCCCGGWPCLLSCAACVCVCTGTQHTPTTQNRTQHHFKAASRGVPAFPLDPVNKSQTLRGTSHLSTGILLCGSIKVQCIVMSE